MCSSGSRCDSSDSGIVLVALVVVVLVAVVLVAVVEEIDSLKNVVLQLPTTAVPSAPKKSFYEYIYYLPHLRLVLQFLLVVQLQLTTTSTHTTITITTNTMNTIYYYY